MSVVTLAEPHEWVAEWQVPGDGASEAGILTYDPAKGLHLRLVRTGSDAPFGNARRVSGRRDDGLPKWPVLHGVAKGIRLTLLDVWVSRMQTTLTSAAAEVEAEASVLLVGCHLDDSDEAAFVGAASEVDWLTAWSGLTAYEITEESDAETNRLTGTTSITTRPVQRRSAMAGEMTVGLFHTFALPDYDSQPSRTFARTWEAVSATATYPTPVSFNDALNPLASLSHLISLSALENCGIVSESLTLPPAPELWPDGHPLQDKVRRVEVYRQHIVPPLGTAKDRPRFLLDLDDIPFEELVPRWLSLHQSLEPVIGMALGLRYLPDGFVEPRVITAVGAAEALHQSLDKATEMPRADHRSLRRAILDVVPSEYQQWVRERIADNKPKLVDRLVSLADLMGAPVRDALLPSAGVWAERSVKARNHLAHTGAAEFDLAELHAVVEVTSAVVILVLLRQLGQSDERLVTAIVEHPELNYAQRLARRHFGAPEVASDGD